MNWTLFATLLAAAAIMLLIERAGKRVTFTPRFKGDIKRESQWFAQYGQLGCVGIVTLLVWRLDHRKTSHGDAYFLVILAAVVGTSLLAGGLKRVFGRVRPGRENAGKFLGFSLRHDNSRESFPSSHSACALAFSAVLATFYPQAAAIFWVLAAGRAALRYVMDAHWPSDVLAGLAAGYGIAELAMHLMGM